MMILYDYFRSTASYRVRIALNLKGLKYETHSIHLINNGGEQHQPEYLAINPQGLVPALKVENQILTQSLAILEYLDECHPNPPLLPKDPLAKATVRALALTIACDIHPLNNLGVTQYLRREFKADDPEVTTWYHHWLKKGFNALENRLSQLDADTGFCYGDRITIADICLIPQVYNAKRFEFDMNPYPCIEKINAHCLNLDAFKQAAPEVQ